MPPIKGMVSKSPTPDNSAINVIHCKTVGETKNNRNGSSRQKIIESDASASDLVYFNQEKISFDLNAMSVYLVKNDKQIGCLPMYIAEDMTERLDMLRFSGVITEVTQEDSERSTLSVKLAIIDCPNQTAQEDLDQWVDAHFSELLQFDSDIVPSKSKIRILLWVCSILAALVIFWIIQIKFLN